MSKYNPVRFDVFITNPTSSVNQNVIFQQSYINNFAKFSNDIPGESGFDLNNGGFFKDVKGYENIKLSYDTIKDLINGTVDASVNPISLTNTVITNEVFWPKQQYTYLSDHRQRENYFNGFWRDDPETRRILGSPSPGQFFVYDNPAFSIPAKDLYKFGINLGRGTGFPDSPGDTPYFQPENSGTFSASIWPLDARKNFETNSPGKIRRDPNEGLLVTPPSAPNFTFRPYISASDGSGILQNGTVPFSSYLYVSHSNPLSAEFFEGYQPVNARLLPQYNRRIQGCISDDLTHEYKFGDTKWEAGEQSGLAPFYDTYEAYAEDIKRSAKDHSIIPEFRISQHMDFYLNNAKDFLVKPPAAYELTGAYVSSTLNQEFEKIYSHSDFLNTFNVVNSDFDSLDNTKITLTADATIKFLPYSGFYPADRTVQIARLFHESYSASFAITGNIRVDLQDGNLIPGETLENRVKGYINPVWKSLFAPGLLYNSIKSGLAVDYPVHTASVTFTGTPNQRNHLGYLKDIPRINSNFDYRVPFEALADPLGSLGGINVLDNEPHPSASVNLTCSLGGAGKLNYVLAMNNFLASTVDFFKEDGKLVTLASVADNDPNFGIGASQQKGGGFIPAFIEGKEYTMRIVCYNGVFNTFQSILNYLDGSGSAALRQGSYNRSKPTIVNYARTGSDPTARSDYYGSSFGPPVKSEGTLDLVTGILQDPNYSSASYEPFTPPYYDGYSHIELTYKPEYTTNDVNLPDLISDLTQSFFRSNTSVLEFGTSALNEMNLDASLNYLQIAKKPAPKFDGAGNVIEIDETDVGNVLTIQPKWECPILNFKNVPVSLPEIGSGSVARGMWHQYGQLPDDTEGVYLQIQDLDPSEIDDPNLTGSLADKLGFSKSPRRVGEVAKQKKISEAIVAIPFKKIHPRTGEKQFYSIRRETINAAIAKITNTPVSITSQLTPSDEVIDMVKKMQKFVLPPHLDFVKNNTISPFAMFIFDFEVTLKQQDLANIWQNLSPEIGRKAIKSNASLPVRLFSPNDTFGTSLMPVFDKDTRWMVFKVKQRSAYNYFAKTADSSDDERFKFNFEFGSRNAEKGSVPDYSYNWPFDFFSLIELGKVSAQHRFDRPIIGNDQAINPETLTLPSIPQNIAALAAPGGPATGAPDRIPVEGSDGGDGR